MNQIKHSNTCKINPYTLETKFVSFLFPYMHSLRTIIAAKLLDLNNKVAHIF